jgi:hypothetical protein
MKPVLTSLLNPACPISSHASRTKAVPALSDVRGKMRGVAVRAARRPRALYRGELEGAYLGAEAGMNCPSCGAMMELRMGREGKAFWQCAQTENHREPLAI